MRYHLGDKFIVQGVEGEVAFINSAGYAYISPSTDGDFYDNKKTYIGLVFAVLDVKGRDRFGERALTVNNSNCGAV